MGGFAQQVSSAALSLAFALGGRRRADIRPGPIVLTGHMGNFGGKLERALLHAGWTVHGIDKRKGPAFDLANTSPDAQWPDVLKMGRTLVHLAATPAARGVSETVERDNFAALQNVFCECCRLDYRTIVFASSLLASPADYRHPSNSKLPIDHYGWSKAFAESVALNLASSTQTRFVAVRFGYVPPRGKNLSEVDAWTRSVITSDQRLTEAFLSAVPVEQKRYSTMVVYGS